MKRYKVIFIGDYAVGKSNIINRLIKNVFVLDNFTTIGIQFQVCKLTYKNIDYSLEFWDTAGQERFRSLLPLYFRNCVIIILVIDVTQDIYSQLRNWLDYYKSNKDLFNTDHYLLIIFNKIDLITNYEIPQHAINIINEYSIKYGIVKTSCKENIGFTEIKSILGDQLSTIKLTNNKNTKIIKLENESCKYSFFSYCTIL